MYKIILKLLLATILGFSCVSVFPPYFGGIYYACCGEHHLEQMWLDRTIDHLTYLESKTDDPELKEVLHYTITKYNRIGPWDVMVMPLISFPNWKTLGCNYPWCPGVTIDPEVLQCSIKFGALVLVHESLHDIYLGHDKINPIMARIENIQ